MKIDLSHIQLDLQQKHSLANQIADGLRQQIQSASKTVGQEMPSVRSAAALLGVNFNTVARAYRILENEGLLSTRSGKGTFLRRDINSDSVGIPSNELDQICKQIKALVNSSSFSLSQVIVHLQMKKRE